MSSAYDDMQLVILSCNITLLMQTALHFHYCTYIILH